MDAERGTAEGAGAGAGSSLLQKLNLPLLLEQTLHVSVSSHCLSRAEMCEPPRVHTVAAYRSSDVSLAQFLTAALPARNRRCADPECSGGPQAHVRSYIHGGGRLTLRVRSLVQARTAARQAVRDPPSLLLSLLHPGFPKTDLTLTLSSPTWSLRDEKQETGISADCPTPYAALIHTQT